MTDPTTPEPAVRIPTSELGWYNWLDQRTGIDSLLHESLDEPIPGGANWAYVFGSGLLFLFVSQVITGICLALYYVPSADHAHTIVSYIVKEVTAGIVHPQHSCVWIERHHHPACACTSGKPFSMDPIRGAGNCCGSPAASCWL